MIRIAAWPYNGTPYTECFYNALTKKGVIITEGDFSISWLFKEIGSIDFFHFHWPSFMYAYRDDLLKTIRYLVRFLLFLLIIRMRGKKVIWTAHNLYPHEKGKKVFVLVDAFIRHVVTGVASLVLAHGNAAAGIVANEFPSAKNKILIIDHGHFIDYYQNWWSMKDARKKLGLSENQYVFLFFGMGRRYKNIEKLITVFRQLNGDVILVIAGRFRDQEYLNSVIEAAKDAGERVRIFAEYIPDEEIQIYLNACNVVVLPYSEILTSGAAMLAISFGRPVIAPRKGYLKDVITECCGLLYDTEDPDALRQTMIKIQNRTYDQYSIIDHANTYDWHQIAGEVCPRLSSLLSGDQQAQVSK